jgi:hypothetical protein
MKGENNNGEIKVAELLDEQFKNSAIKKAIITTSNGEVFILQINRIKTPWSIVPIFRSIKIKQCAVGKPLEIELYKDKELKGKYISSEKVDNIFLLPKH